MQPGRQPSVVVYDCTSQKIAARLPGVAERGANSYVYAPRTLRNGAELVLVQVVLPENWRSRAFMDVAGNEDFGELVATADVAGMRPTARLVSVRV